MNSVDLFLQIKVSVEKVTSYNTGGTKAFMNKVLTGAQLYITLVGDY